jgi:hypothetical protein
MPLVIGFAISPCAMRHTPSAPASTGGTPMGLLLAITKVSTSSAGVPIGLLLAITKAS